MEFETTKPRARIRALGLIAVAGLLAAACSPAASTAPSAAAPTEAASPSEGAASPGASADPMADLITAAKAEGALTAIALPDDWCNYGEVIKAFETKYGIDVTVLDPLTSSGKEIEAIKANVGNPGPQNPDVVDVGYAFGEANKDLFEPYKVSTWDTIPESAKSADGSVVRRLLRRHVVRDEHRGRPQSSEGLGRSAQARVQEPGRARRRPASTPTRPSRPSTPRHWRTAEASTTRSRASTSGARSSRPETSCRSTPTRRRSSPAPPRSRSSGPTTDCPAATSTRRST